MSLEWGDKATYKVKMSKNQLELLVMFVLSRVHETKKAKKEGIWFIPSNQETKREQEQVEQGVCTSLELC